MSTDPPAAEFVYVETAEGLRRAASVLTGARAIAVDTEADGMHSFFEKVCLVQIAADDGSAFVIDPLALDGMAELAPVFSDSAAAKIFHGADFDVVGMRRDFGFQFGRISCPPIR